MFIRRKKHLFTTFIICWNNNFYSVIVLELSSSESEVEELKTILNKENNLEDVEKLVGECSTLLRYIVYPVILLTNQDTES